MSRLPTFSLQEKSYIKGTSDFLGLGHFTTRYITQRKYPSHQGPSYQNDRDLVELVDPNWPDMGSSWLYYVPWGFRRLLNFAQVLIPSSCVPSETFRPEFCLFQQTLRWLDRKTDQTLGMEAHDYKPSPWEAGCRKVRNLVSLYTMHTELKASLNCMRLHLQQRKTAQNNNKKVNKPVNPVPCTLPSLHIGLADWCLCKHPLPITVENLTFHLCAPVTRGAGTHSG